ncbi:HTH-type transcriptional regulator DmlR [Massilia sp. Bi118]|uniref:LysR family transcriptional regulator n=1 Tax=Massilia sp. Bi118 TaxID=2822346 RepID=UPI001D658FA0|nr:LysR family transcriptional regulator [Massilia sp. Bi118]CAH0282734.1 HTH-type transcriptional regulator DmlR [Massilia sp. Bi118]
MDHLLALRAFVRIAEAGSFGKAADQLGVPRSTASKLIQDLEVHLETRLLQRTTRRITVTPEGAQYYERALRLITDLEEMDAQARGSRAQPKGRLRVGIGSSLANLVLLPALPDFQRRYPDIALHLGVSDLPADLVGEGIDCVIRGGALDDTTLVARKLCEMDFVTCAAPGYLKAFGTPAHPRELETKHRLFSYASTQTGKPFPLRFLQGDESIEIDAAVAAAVNESTAHITGLAAGLGIGQTFRFAVRGHLERGELVRVLEDWTQPRFPLYAMYPSSRHLNAKVRVFVDWAVELFAALDDRA